MSVNWERVQLLVTALRSREFKQGTGQLRIVDEAGTRHCCLGVATEVALRSGLDLGEVQRDVEETGFNHWGHLGSLPESVTAWYGFERQDPYVIDPVEGIPYMAAALNDQYKRSFEEIATAFELTYLQDPES